MLLLMLTAVVLISNVRYLYIAPVANSFNWWQGDETWLMAEANHFIHTAHYINPLAPGSAYSECSGLLFGSCYVTATIYGIPLLLIKSHTIDAGRTVSWVFALWTLLALWLIAKRYRVPPVLRAFGCLLFASTLCFFITSHCARSDTLVGLSILIIVGCLPLMDKKSLGNKDIYLGLLFPCSLLLNGHILIHTFLLIVYISLSLGTFRNGKSIVRMAGAALAGFVVLLMIQEILLGSSSLLGPFSGSSGRMPIMRLFHPKADMANVSWRLFIVNAWAPAVLWISIVIVVSMMWARVRFNIRLSGMEPAAQRMLIGAILVIFPSLFLEYYEPRYLIYVLPTIILSFILILSYLLKTLPRSSTIVVRIALIVCMTGGLWRYWIDTSTIGTGAEKITATNNEAVKEALATIHTRHPGVPRIYSTVTAEGVAMDDSCILITPIMYYQPIDAEATREDLWKRAKIDYAIVCNPAHSLDWNETDSCIDWRDRSNAKMIFERVGPLWDIGRSYDANDLKLLDTLRVYEFR
jgi:hypothetical protein